MAEQNYQTHRKLVFPFHVLTLGAIILLLVCAIRSALTAPTGYSFISWLLILTALILLSLFFYIRSFPLKAQDRAIKAEETLRYYILTGKRLDQRLTIGQIIALRFASDDEIPTLADRAIAENLNNNAIKKEIKSWRADNHRA